MIDYPLRKIRYRQYYQKMRPLLGTAEVRAYTMAILSFFSMSFFGFFAVRPTLVTITNLRRKIEDSKILNKKLEQKINMVVKAQKEYEIIRGALPAIYTTIPDSPNFVSVIKALEKLANENSASVSSIRLTPFVLKGKKKIEKEKIFKKEKVQSFEVSLTLTGEYQAIENFLKHLSRLRRTLLIESLTINEGPTAGQLNLILKINAYFSSLSKSPKSPPFTESISRRNVEEERYYVLSDF